MSVALTSSFKVSPFTAEETTTKQCAEIDPGLRSKHKCEAQLLDVNGNVYWLKKSRQSKKKV